MIRNRCRARFVLVAFGGLVLAGSVAAQVPDVKDDGGFFSEAAVREAREAIKEMKLLYKKDLSLETFPGVPADKAAQFKELEEAADRRKFMATWARSRQQALHVDGIYILVCKNPTKLEVIVDPKTVLKVFPVAERNKLRDVLVASFKAKQYDQGLADAVALVRRRFEEQLGKASPVTTPKTKEETPQLAKTALGASAEKPGTRERAASAPAGMTFNPMWIVWVVLILLGLWIVIGLLRALFGHGARPAPREQPYIPPQPYQGQPQGQPYPQGPPQYGQGGPSMPAPGYGGRPPMAGPAPAYGQSPPPAQGGGGGFLPSMLGGMFGGAAGGWIYDKFSGRSAGSGASFPPASYPQAPAARPIGGAAGAAAGAGAAGYASGGGVLDDKTTDPGSYASSGGDFGARPAKPADYAGAGADFGQKETTSAGGGADFGAEDTQAAGGGGDFGGDDAKGGGGGGDFGSEAAEQVAESSHASGGGDFGGDASKQGEESGGDFGGAKSAGGDFGSEPAEPVAESGGAEAAGGDFGSDAAEQPAESGAEPGGDFGQTASDTGATDSGGDFSTGDAGKDDADSSGGNF